VLQAEIERLREEGILGDDALGSGRRLQLEIFTSPGGYILGEESALLECMEGHRGEPRNKPPFPGLYGLWGKPTLMNSVETFADVPIILERGADWWKAQGVNGATGLKFFASPATSSAPTSTACGRLDDPRPDRARRRRDRGREVGAIQPGGASSNFLGPEHLDVPLDWKPLQEAGSMLGSGAVIVMAEGTNLLAAAPTCCASSATSRAASASPAASARTRPTRSSATRRAGQGRRRRPDKITQLEETLRLTSICGLGQVALGPVLSVSGSTAAAPRARAPQGPRRHRDVARR
jgi:NADH:ubiquinone oxidoreductase subunit F (NADH-binding)